MEIIIVQCDRDIARWPLQAYSLGRFLDPLACECLKIYYNGLNFETFSQRIHEYAYLLGQLRGKLTLHDSATQFKTPFHLDGWHGQQAIKLLAATYSQSAFYMVLDAKNFLLRPVGHQDLVKDGKPVSFLMDNDNHLATKYKNSFALLGGKPRFPINWSMPAWTPYILKRDIVLGLLDWIKHNQNNPTLTSFLIENDVTEFFLYAASLSRSTNPEVIYHFQEPFVTSIWKKALSSPERFQARLAAISDPKFLFCGIHTHVFQFMDKRMSAALYATLAKVLKIEQQKIANLIPER